MTMEAYSGLARVYDYLLSGIDYEEWAAYIEQLFDTYQVEPRRRIMDLACGTGNSTLPWAQRGYEAWGVDISGEMLAVARGKGEQQKGGDLTIPVAFYQQDMRTLQLPGQVDVALLYQDGLNYLLTTSDLHLAFSSICRHVRPGGFFIFNNNMVEKLPTGNTPQLSMLDEPEMTLLWESDFNSAERIWRIKLIAYLREKGSLYHKIEEEHRERSHSREELETIFTQTGWKLRACLKAFTLEEPSATDRNIFYVIQRQDI